MTSTTSSTTTTAPPAPAPHPRRTAAQAKADLLAWADQTDEASKANRPSLATILGGGTLAVVGGVLLVRLLSPKPTPTTSPAPASSRLVRLLVAARVARSLAPLALSAARTMLAPKAPKYSPKESPK